MPSGLHGSDILCGSEGVDFDIGAGFDHFGSRQKARFCLLHIRCEVIAFGHCGFSRGDV